MPRLPSPGSDNGTWGSILNDFLAQSHKSDGTLKDSVITNAAISDGTIQEAKLSSGVQTKLNAVAGTPDWNTITNKPAVIAAGTTIAAAKAVVNLSNVDNTSDATKNAAVATLTNKTISGASNTLSNIAQSSVTNLVSDLSGKASSAHTHPALDISDSTLTGRALLSATDAAAAKTVLSLTKSDVGLANANNTSDLNKPISIAGQAALDAKADLVGGVVPTAQLPSLAFNTAVTVADETAMLALTTGDVQPGDLAIRTDGAGTFILTGSDPSQLSDWTLLDSPTAPVTSVNSQTGTVVLSKTDVGLGNIDNTSDLNKPISIATQAALDDKADLVGGVIPSSQLPAISLNTVVTVADQAAMLALTSGQVQPGDIAVRTDGAGSFILTASDPSILANWTLLNAPSDAVTSVNGQTGTVALAKSDVGLGNVDNTSDATKNAAVATLTNKTIDADNNTVSNIEVDNFKASAIVTESDSIASNDNDTTIPTSAAVKDYVDSASSGGGGGSPYDLSIVSFGATVPRSASSYGDFPFGVKLARNVTFTQVVYRGNTADASGDLVVELRKNGSQVVGTSKSIAAADQTTGGANATATGSWSFSAGDILTVYVTGVGTTPGTGLIADITGTA